MYNDAVAEGARCMAAPEIAGMPSGAAEVWAVVAATGAAGPATDRSSGSMIEVARGAEGIRCI